jgi:hypothetical protein
MKDGLTKVVDIAVDCPKCGSKAKCRLLPALRLKLYANPYRAHIATALGLILPGELVGGPSVTSSTKT